MVPHSLPHTTGISRCRKHLRSSPAAELLLGQLKREPWGRGKEKED